jgi:hypothetical protein
MWVKDDSAGYGNLDTIFSVYAVEVTTGTWVLRAFLPNDRANYAFQLAGTWPSQADAINALRQLVDGADPSTY